MLTQKQYELLLFIHRRTAESGFSPSFDEMREALGLRSKSGVHRLVSALEERGFIRRLANKARAIEVVRLPDAAMPQRPAGPRRFAPAVITGARARHRAGSAPRIRHEVVPETVQIPVMGRIAAGVPVEAIQTRMRSIGLPVDVLGNGDHFALEVQGDSMVDAGILEGDLAILQRADHAGNGDIVVALVNGEEATLKRLRKKGDTVALEPANTAYETQIYGASRVRIQGRLEMILRRY